MSARKVFGIGPVTELLGSHPNDVLKLYVRAGRAGASPKKDPLAALARQCRELGIAVLERSADDLVKLAGPGARHQGVVALAQAFGYADVDDVLAAAEARGEPPLVVALDGVTDPHNLGAIARSALVLGAHGLIVPRDRAGKVTPGAVKASAGALERLPVAQVVNLARTLEELKERGLWIAAVVEKFGAAPGWTVDASGPLCLVLGSEGHGLRSLIARACDLSLSIPMSGTGVGSLNVAVAAGIALYEARRQRDTIA